MTSEMKALCIKNASSVAGAAMFAKAPDITPTYDKKSRLTNTVCIESKSEYLFPTQNLVYFNHRYP